MPAPAQPQQPPPSPPGGGNGNGQLTPFQQSFKNFRTFLQRFEKQIEMALPKHVRPDRLIRIVLTEVTKNPDLIECTQESMVASILHAAQLGLDIGAALGQAYLVPFRNNQKGGQLECQLIPGYKGLVKLAYQSGQVGAIRARVVHAKDEFDYEYGIDEVLVHKPYRKPDPGELQAVYAVAKIKGLDESQFLVLERWEVEQIRDRFSKQAKKGPWVNDFEEMAKKSAIRRLCKLLPASVENDALQRAVTTDERAETGLAPDYDNAIDIQPIMSGIAATDDDEAPAGDRGAQGEQPQSDLDRLAASSRAARGKQQKSLNIQVDQGKEKGKDREPGGDDDEIK